MRKEVDKKLEEGQFGFKKGRGLIQYILYYLVNKKISKKKGKIFAFFVDLKMAFDRIDRVKPGEMLRKTGMREQLRRKIMEIYIEIKTPLIFYFLPLLYSSSLCMFPLFFFLAVLFEQKVESDKNEPHATQHLPHGSGD